MESNHWLVVCSSCPPEPTPCVASQRCPANWTEINSSCYFLSTEARTWENSRKYCQSEDADLAVIDNDQEQVRCTLRFSRSIRMDVFYWETFKSHFFIISINRGPCTDLGVMLLSCSGLVCMALQGSSSGWMDLLWPNRKALRITINHSNKSFASPVGKALLFILVLLENLCQNEKKPFINNNWFFFFQMTSKTFIFRNT